jgi:DNA-binding MarR family transcriptional regulator
MGKQKANPGASRPGNVSSARPLFALLSQALVAFIVEFDNEFERRMAEAGQPGALLSMVLWSNLIRFIATHDLSVAELVLQALAPKNRIEFELGCLERWGFIALRADPVDDRPIPKRLHGRAGRMLRDGWGSGRGIRSGWMVTLTERGRTAAAIWPPLFGDIEQRWLARFGNDDIANLRQALEDVVKQLDVALPHALPGGCDVNTTYPEASGNLRGWPRALPVLLSQSLLAFTLEFNRESPTPLILCANTLRVVAEAPVETPVAVADIPRLTGGSPETSGIGWQIKPYVSVKSDPAGARKKVVRLTPKGQKAHRKYRELIGEIEGRWEVRFGQDKIRRIRECLSELFVARNGDRLLIAEGLIPAKGTVRSGEQRPALGRRDIGTAARQRMRDLVAQTETFLRDPINSLPHYPLWDMNRGFGP